MPIDKERYLERVSEIRASQESRRRFLEGELRDLVNGGAVTTEDIAQRIDDIDADIARGMPSSYTYNRSNDPRYNKTQPTRVRLDDDGNILTEFVDPGRRLDTSLTGQPIPVGTVWITEKPSLDININSNTPVPSSDLNDRLRAMGIDPTDIKTPEQVAKEQAERRRLADIEQYEAKVADIEERFKNWRAHYEGQLERRIEAGTISEDEIVAERAKIEETLAQGVPDSHTYNGRYGDKWARSQPTLVRLDDNGDILTEFIEPSRPLDTSLTGQPVAVGTVWRTPNPLAVAVTPPGR